MSRSLLSVTLAALALAACGPAAPPATLPTASTTDSALAPAIAAVTPLDYAQPAYWLCRPGAGDACEQVATITRVIADGILAKQGASISIDQPVDCFYAYPTISNDPTGNSDAMPGAEETEIARQQFAHFAGTCRLFAPVYRQVTLTALRKLGAGEAIETNREMAYADVKAAWRHYLANDNAGRGVVFIGHDQGAGLLTRLIAAEIDGKPEQGRLVSAILPGADIEIPQDANVGGSFAAVPLCNSATSIGCVIAWSAFRAEAPPPAGSLFGRAATTGMKVACVNPAELDPAGAGLSPVFPTGPAFFDELADPARWTFRADGALIETPFVAFPGLLSGRCINRDGASYLAITVNADPARPRPGGPGRHIVTDLNVRPEWGLHAVDMHLAMGNLVNIVSSQSAAWLAAQATPLDPL